MNYAYLIQFSIFVALQITGMTHQIVNLINKSDSGEFAGILNFSDLISSPLPLYILQYLLIAITITTLFIVSQAHFAVYLSHKLEKHINNKKISISLWAIISNSALLIANSAWFIHSPHLTEWFYTWPAIHLNTYACLIFLIVPLGLYLWQKKSNKLVQTSAAVLLSFTAIFYLTSHNHHSSTSTPKSSKPNIILIGIDSLRSDLIATHMPYLSKQLVDTVQFKYAYTPLGRTFPAWNSILSGLYPVNHGARINLIDESNLVSSEQYLATTLKKQGYHTLFAIDETRFANLGPHQGFDNVISPRVGASDFLIASLADYPLTNLLSLLPISSWLLPEIYANRGAATTYRAEAFSELLNRRIPAAHQPMFLSVHFCLAHWPYYFASQFKPNSSYPEPYYPANLQAIDLQIKALMNDLKAKGYLDNSKIIFLSDHGEAWAEESLAFNNTDTENTEHPQHHRKERGHGSSLVSTSSAVLMSFKGFNQDALALNASKLATLADIKPTILDELNISHSSHNDGQSLLTPDLPSVRYIPIETGTTLNIDEKDQVDVNQLVKDMLNRYELKSNGLLRIKANKVADGLNAKIKGVRTIEQVLSQHEDNSFRLFNLINHSFEHFDDLTAVKVKQRDWFNAWCYWYKTEDPRCTTPF